MAATTPTDGLPYPDSSADTFDPQGDIADLALGVDGKYVRRSTVTAKGDLLTATGAGQVVRKPAGINGRLLAADSSQSDGLSWTDPQFETASTKEWGYSGVLAVRTGQSRWYPPHNITLLSVSGSVGTAPSGSEMRFNVLRNGSPVITGWFQIAAGSNYVAPAAPTITALTAGTHYLTVDIEKVGTSTPGSDLLVIVRYRRAL